jgi:large subunit ribosomal protein L17
MRHGKKTVKLGRSQAHRDALLSNQVCSLIEHGRIQTTLAKAKAVRPLAEKMLTLGKKASLHNRRTAMAVLGQKDAVKKLFDEIAPRSATRKGGYTRIIKLGYRKSDAAPLALIEWVDAAVVEEVLEPVTEKKAKAKAVKPEAAEAGEAKPKKAAAKKPKAEKAEAEEPKAE